MNKMNKIRCFINIKFQLALVMKISGYQTIIYTFTLQAQKCYMVTDNDDHCTKYYS